MEIRYRLTEEDYVQFNLFHIKHSKAARRTLTIQRVIPPVLFLLVAWVFAEIGHASFLGLLITFSIVAVLWVIFYPSYFDRAIIRSAKRMMKDGNNEGLLGEHHLVMTEEGIVDSTSYGETKVSWGGIKAFKEDRHSFYLYNSAVSAYIIPKRELKNIEEIRSYLHTKLKHIESENK
ncbi:YcxB family protein [Anoxybacillus rupiensis]|uniref:YcxB family protein n=1 Tax=Anoxybacteroides rupiense TaxID=311460 RepID=A0ABD5IUF8_9BACL|nr:YcxB family protein [Anoxybacillus rupiensis]